MVMIHFYQTYEWCSISFNRHLLGKCDSHFLLQQPSPSTEALMILPQINLFYEWRCF